MKHFRKKNGFSFWRILYIGHFFKKILIGFIECMWLQKIVTLEQKGSVSEVEAEEEMEVME